MLGAMTTWHFKMENHHCTVLTVVDSVAGDSVAGCEQRGHHESKHNLSAEQ